MYPWSRVLVKLTQEKVYPFVGQNLTRDVEN